MHKQLLTWYKEQGRHSLPWRNTTNSYHIYLSEIMLQQTQVSRVRDEYYPKFLDKYPSLDSLAKAKLEDVFALWSGLGYYRRAKNLHATAQLCTSILPSTLEELKRLPGIGAYTASALCSFAYEQSVPVVDTNIARVLKRFFALLNPKDKEVWSSAKEFLNTQDSRHHNLALMDLGSLVCLPKNPLCTECPLQKECKGKSTPQLYTKTKKKEYISLELFFGICIKEHKIALEVSQESMYRGMLILPRTDPIEEHFLGNFKHSYTKYRLDVKLYLIEEPEGEIIWLDLEKFDEAPISSLTKKAKKVISQSIVNL